MKQKKKTAPKRYHNIREMLDFIGRERGQAPAFLEKKGGGYLSVSYAKTRSDVKALGVSLLRRGLGGKKILLIGEGSYPWCVACLTALCGLGVIIPLSKAVPNAELAEIAKLTGASAIIYSDSCESKISALPKKLQRISFDELLLLCDRGMSFSDGELREFENLPIDVDSAALISFTGNRKNTGERRAPLGITLSQRNLCSSLEGLSKAIPCTRKDSTLAILKPHSLFELITGILHPLSQGASIYFCEDRSNIMKNAKEASPTYLVCSRALIEILRDSISEKLFRIDAEKKFTGIIRLTEAVKIKNLRNKMKKDFFPELHAAFGGRLERFVVFGVSPSLESVKLLKALGFEVICVYGTPECSALAAVSDPRSKTETFSAFPSGELRIQSKRREAEGEIFYRGDNVMVGYFREEELTRKVKLNGWIQTDGRGSLDSDNRLTLLT